MPENFSGEDFARQLKTKFLVRLEDGRAFELELEEVKTLPDLTDARGDVERFTLYFHGAGDFCLPQMMYRLEHEQMGDLDIFLVPIERDERGFRYEAVFSFFK